MSRSGESVTNCHQLSIFGHNLSGKGHSTMEDYKVDYEEFWKDIVEENGVLNLDQIKRELFDFHNLMQNVSKVYMEITGGMISKQMTDPDVVIAVANDRIQDLVEEEIKDRMENTNE